jgi:hypothetical protein
VDKKRVTEPGRNRAGVTTTLHLAVTAEKYVVEPTFKGVWSQRCMLLRGRPLLPGLVHTHSLPDEQRRGLDTLDLEALGIGPGAVPQPPWRQAGDNHGRGGRGCGPFLPRDVLVMRAERQVALAWEHGLPPPPPHRAHGPCRQPGGLHPPHRTNGGGRLAPAPAWVHRDGVCLRRLAPLGIRTRLWPPGGRPAGPSMRVRRGAHGLWAPPEAIADRNPGGLSLRRTAPPFPLLRDPNRVHPRGQAMGTPRPLAGSTGGRTPRATGVLPARVAPPRLLLSPRRPTRCPCQRRGASRLVRPGLASQ